MLIFSWSGTDPVPTSGVVRDSHSAVASFGIIGVLVLCNFDREVQIVRGSVVNCDVMRQQFPTPLQLILEPIDRRLHLVNGLLIDAFWACHFYNNE